nr:MAG TPA: hypothetical protein [Bacteriophage sp.]
MTCNRALAQGDFCLLALIFCQHTGLSEFTAMLSISISAEK